MVDVKICGLTTPGQADVCVRAGAWGVGVVLAPESSRFVDVETAAEVMSAAGPVARVGVFVDAGSAEVARAAKRIGLTHLQLHGTVDVAAVRRATGLPIILGVPFTGTDVVAAAGASGADLVLFDAAVPGRHGGTGVRLDWDALAEARPDFAFGVAGGLRPDNVTQAIRLLRPAFVDVSSGVESAPGHKDQDKIVAFMTAVRSA